LGVVQPFGTIRNSGTLSSIAKKVADLAKTWSASEIIVGVPLDSNGILSYDVKNFNGRLCLDFSKVLSAVCTHEYEGKFQTILFDERYTTKEAQLRLQMESIKGRLRIEVCV
jgi:RNase H-fold protein (predicted Holliday junction resolvase)